MKYSPKNQVKVDGKMNEVDAGIVGKQLAKAATYTGILFGVAALLAGAAQLAKVFLP